MTKEDTIILGLKEIMGFYTGQRRSCEYCVFCTYTDDGGYLCNYNRAIAFATLPQYTCDFMKLKVEKQ